MVLAARGEALEQRGGEHRGGNTGVDGRLDRPPALAGIGDPAGQSVERGVLLQGRGGQVEQPRGDDRSAAPQLGDLGGVDGELVELRLLQGRHFGGVLGLMYARVGMLEDVQTLGERGHDAVLDAVVHHLHEVAGPGRTAVQVAELLGREVAFAAGRALDLAAAGGDGLQDGLDPREGLVGSPDHEAVPAVQAEDATAGSDVDVVDSLRLQCGGAANVVAVVRVAAVDDDVPRLEHLGELIDDAAGEAGGDHQPHHARALQGTGEIGQTRRARCAFGDEGGHGILIDVVDDAVVAIAHQPSHDVRAHPSQSHHRQLHRSSLRFAHRTVRLTFAV